MRIAEAKIINLDPWNLFIYICLIQLADDKKSEFQISAPKIGINSQIDVFKVFKGKNVIIDANGKELSLPLTVYLDIFLTPFIETYAMTMKAVTTIKDLIKLSRATQIPLNFIYQKVSNELNKDSKITNVKKIRATRSAGD